MNKSLISFETAPYKVGSWTIVRLPQSASTKLPSRAMTMVEGTINRVKFRDVLEPDGNGSHWLAVSQKLAVAAKVKPGDKVSVEVWPTTEWVEPEVPADLKKALSAELKAKTLWFDITPNARWDWIRWIRSTKQDQTRQRRIKVAISKLNSGTRRPCCFNRNLCTVPEITKNWVLLET